MFFKNFPYEFFFREIDLGIWFHKLFWSGVLDVLKFSGPLCFFRFFIYFFSNVNELRFIFSGLQCLERRRRCSIPGTFHNWSQWCLETNDYQRSSRWKGCGRNFETGPRIPIHGQTWWSLPRKLETRKENHETGSCRSGSIFVWQIREIAGGYQKSRQTYTIFIFCESLLFFQIVFLIFTLQYFSF